MPNTGGIVLFVCVGLLAIHAASATRSTITCYQCQRCSNDFKQNDPKISLVNCTSPAACYKVQFNDYVNRGCSNDRSGSDVCETKTVDGNKAAECSCVTSYCNSSSATEVPIATILVFAFTAFVKKWY